VGVEKDKISSCDQVFVFVYTKCNALFIDDFSFGHLPAQVMNRLNLSSRFFFENTNLKKSSSLDKENTIICNLIWHILRYL
jgi:hypothetical protein